jgi:VanZ family protein
MQIFIRVIFYISIIIVCWLSLVKAEDINYFNNLSFSTDKLVHFLIYFYLTILGLISNFKIPDIYIALFIFLFSCLIEVVHIFHPYRFFEYFDLLANLFGVTIATIIFSKKGKKIY